MLADTTAHLISDTMQYFKWLIICAFISCNDTNNVPLGDFDKQGHRGCRGLMPENTLPAMIHAINTGVTTLEMDICITSDLQPILSHEPFFNHEISTLPGGEYVQEKDEKQLNIYRMSYNDIRKIDVGMKPHPRFPRQKKVKAYKPLLSEVIDSVERYVKRQNITPVHYNIETKTTSSTDNIFHPTPEVFVDTIMSVINARNISERVVIQSFDIRTLQYLRKKYPLVRTALLIEASEGISIENKIKSLGFSPDVVSPEFHLVNDAMIKRFHEQKIQIIPWTVNDRVQIKKLKEMGVDGIITDYPDLF